MKASSWFLVQFLFIIILCSLKSCNSLASLHFMSRGCCSSGIVISVMPFQSRVLFLPTSFLDCLTAGLQVVQVFDTSSSLTIPWFTPIISFTSALMIILVLDANHSRKSLCNQNESRHETLLSKITSSRLEKPVLSAAKLVLGEQNHFLNYTLEMTGDSVMSLERVKCSIVSPLWAPLVFLQKQNKKTQKSIQNSSEKLVFSKNKTINDNRKTFSFEANRESVLSNLRSDLFFRKEIICVIVLFTRKGRDQVTSRFLQNALFVVAFLFQFRSFWPKGPENPYNMLHRD